MAFQSIVEFLVKGRNEASDALDAVDKDIKQVGNDAAKADAQVKEFGNQVKQAGLLSQAAGIAVGVLSSQIVVELAGALGKAAKEAFDFAEKVQDIVDKSGATAEGIQKISYVAKQAGIDMGQVGQALVQLNRHLAEGNKQTQQDLALLGLKLSDLRNLKPDEVMFRLAEAATKTGVSTQKLTDIVGDLMGRGGLGLLPIMNDEMRRLGDEAERAGAIVGASQIKAMDDVRDTWTRLYEDMKGILGTAVGGIAILIQPVVAAVEYGLRKFIEFDSWLTSHFFATLKQAKLMFFGIFSPDELPAVMGPAKEGVDKLKQSVEDLRFKTIDVKQAEADFGETLEQQKKRLKDVADHIKKINDLRAELFGDKTIQKAADLVEAIGNLDKNLKKISDEEQVKLNKMVLEAIDAYTRLGKVAPQSMQDLAKATEMAVARTVALKIPLGDATDLVRELGKQSQVTQELFSHVPEVLQNTFTKLPGYAAEVKKLGTFWTELRDGVVDVLHTVDTAVEGSFAQMLLGAKGWKDGMLDVWHSLKAGVLNILNEILSMFIHKFILGMIAAMTGAQGGFSGAFKGMFGGLGGGGGQGGGGGFGGILGGIFGGGGGGGGGGADIGDVYGTGEGGGGGGGFGGMANMGSLARFGGGGMLALGGILQLMKARGKGANTLAGLQAGAGIGTMIMPGIGTAIGAGVGALAGFIKGLFSGPSETEVQGRGSARDAEAEILKMETAAQKAATGGEHWKDVLVTVRDAYLGIGMKEKDAEADVKRLWDAEREGPDAVAKVFAEINAHLEEFKKKQAESSEKVGDQTEATAQTAADAWKESTGEIAKSLEGLGPDALTVKNQIMDILGRLKIKIPIEWDVPPAPNAPPGTSPTGSGNTGVAGETPTAPNPGDVTAAGGIYASGARGVATWFGEGGEPEVGGPAVFFQRIFERLGVGKGGGGGGGRGPIINNWYVTGILSDGDLATTINRKVGPMFVDALDNNVGGLRTRAREVLGVTTGA